MLAIKSIFKQNYRKIAVVLFAGLLWLMSLPATSVQAAGYYSGDYAGVQQKAEEKMGSYANTTPNIGGDDYFESGKEAAKVIPKDLGTGSRQKNPGEMLKRFTEELGNDQPQRAFGAKDYDKSEIEKELARNKGE